MNANKKNTIFLLLLVAIVLIYSLTGNSIGIYLDFGENALQVSASDLDWYIPYEQISGLTLIQLPDVGSMQDGIDKAKLKCGTWENDTWGNYILCVAPKVDTCIVLTRKDGSTFVLNYESSESTAELYKMFTELLQSKGYYTDSQLKTFVPSENPRLLKPGIIFFLVWGWCSSAGSIFPHQNSSKIFMVNLP